MWPLRRATRTTGPGGDWAKLVLPDLGPYAPPLPGVYGDSGGCERLVTWPFVVNPKNISQVRCRNGRPRLRNVWPGEPVTRRASAGGKPPA